MIGNISYEDMTKLADSLAISSSNIKEIIKKYNFDNRSKINDFCDTIDAYSRFLITYIELYKNSDEALKYMIEKNK